MSASRSICRSLGRTLAVVMIAGAILASSALGSLTIHLLYVPDPESPPAPYPAPPAYGGAVVIDPANPQPVTMQIWASITAPDNGTMIDDGLYKFYSAFRSSNGGLILGDLEVALNFVGDQNYHWFQGESAHWGYRNDLEGALDMTDPGHPIADPDDPQFPGGNDSDYHYLPRSGDGDLDIGHAEIGKPAPPWFQVRHRSGTQYTDEEYSPLPFGDPGPQGNPTNDFLIAYLTFTPLTPDLDDWDAGWEGPEYNELSQSGVTEIWADPRQNGAAQWEENGDLKINYTTPNPDQGELLGGEKVILYVASQAEMPAGGPAFEVKPENDAGNPVILDGSAATGSINWWGWDFDGDGDYDLQGVGEVAEVTYDMLKGLDDATVTMGEEWPDGMTKPATLTVGWSNSDPINTDVVGFDLTIIPEPATIALLVAGALVTRLRRRR